MRQTIDGFQDELQIVGRKYTYIVSRRIVSYFRTEMCLGYNNQQVFCTDSIQQLVVKKMNRDRSIGSFVCLCPCLSLCVPVSVCMCFIDP